MIILHEIWLIVRYGYAKGAHSYLEAHKRYSLELFMKKKKCVDFPKREAEINKGFGV